MRKLLLLLLVSVGVALGQNPHAIVVHTNKWCGTMPETGGPYLSGTLIRSTLCGPYTSGGALWIVAEESQTSVFANSKVTVYKSLDSGATWNAVDGLNGPQPMTQDNTNTNHFGTFQVANVGTSLYVLYTNGNHLAINGLTVATFDMGAGLWGATTGFIPGTDGASSTGGMPSFGLTAPSAGVFIVAYTTWDFVTSHTATNYIRWNGAVWGAATPLVGLANDTILLGMFLDPATNNTFIAYGAINAGNPRTVKHVTLNAAGTQIGASTITSTYTTQFGGNTNIAFNQGVVFGGNILWPYMRYDVGLNQTFPATFIGTTAASAVPVWTTQDTTATNVSNSLPVLLQAVLSGGSLYVFWSNGFDQLWYNSRAGGAFGADVLYYDSDLVPEPGLPVKNPSVISPSAGNFSVEVSMGNVANFLLPPAPPPPSGQNYIMSDQPNFGQKTNFIRSN